MRHPQATAPDRSRTTLLTAGSACVLFLYAALLAAFSVTGFPSSMVSQAHWPTLIDKPVGEDGYYMLTVADNIASTGHILYNRGLPATGIQPLATVALAGLDWTVHLFGGSVDALIRSVLLLGVLLHVCFAWQMSRIARTLSPQDFAKQAAALAFALTLSSFTLFRLFTYGLETGFYLVSLAVCFQITLQIARRHGASFREVLLLGVAAGIAGEFRIDFGLLFAVILIVLLLYRWITPVGAVVAGAVALSIVAPWLWFVHSVSGAWLPSSGQAESTWISRNVVSERLVSMFLAVTGQVMPWCYAVVSWASVAVAIVSVAVLAILLMRPGRRRVLKSVLFSRHSSVWLSSFTVLILVYFLLFNATHFYYRYVAPVVLVTVPAFAIGLAHSQWVRRHLLLTGAFFWAVFTVWAAGSLHMGRIGNSQTIVAGYVHDYFPRTHVGAFQSGVVGFFNRNVENLDGKLNQGALNATSHHELPAFIDREGIDVLIDWPSVLHKNLPMSYLKREWEPCPVAIPPGDESICLERKGTNRGASNEQVSTTGAQSALRD